MPPPPVRPATEQLTTLKKRRDFLALRGGARWATESFVLEGKRRKIFDARADEIVAGPERMVDGAPRFGFTVTKRLGSAVVRNRIRRRLRESLRQGAAKGLEGCDYVVIARQPALHRRGEALRADLAKAMDEVNRRLSGRPGTRTGSDHGAVGRKHVSRPRATRNP